VTTVSRAQTVTADKAITADEMNDCSWISIRCSDISEAPGICEWLMIEPCFAQRLTTFIMELRPENRVYL
jgi:hypothetical protein